MLAVALMSFGCMNTWAEDVVDATSVKVKMTYVGNNTAYIPFAPDSIAGVCDTIAAGYNAKTWNGHDLPEVGDTIAWARPDWNANWIGYLQVDATKIPGTIQKATLKAKISGSTDNKRKTGWGLALTDNKWSDQLSYNVTKGWTVSKLLNNGVQVYNTQKSSKVFEEVSFDITDALAGADATGIATIIVIETEAAGGYMTEPVVEVTYDPYEKAEKKIDFEDGDVSMFSIFDPEMISVTAVDNADVNSKVAEFKYLKRSNVNLALYDFSELAGSAALVNFEFDFNVSDVAGQHRISIGDALVHNGTSGGFKSGNNNWNYGGNGAILQFGVERGKLNGSSNENYFAINDVAKAGSILDIKAADVFGQWMHAKVSVNVEARTVSYEISKGEEVLFAGEALPFYSESASKCTEFDVSFSNAGTSYIDNLSITSYKSNAVFADYTIKYVDADGNELKEARVGNGQVGKPITLLDSDKAAIEANGKKYVYDSDNSAEVVIEEEGTVVVVKFREAEKYYAVLNCKAGSEILYQYRNLEEYWFYEGDKFYLYPSRAYKGQDGGYYFTPATSWNGVVFEFPGAAVKQTGGGRTLYVGTQDYALVDTVAYYANCEDLALPTVDEGNGTGLGQLVGTVNSWWSFSGGVFDRFSQARGIRLDADSYFYTEPIAEAGTYKVSIYGRNDVDAVCPEPYVLGLRDANGEVSLYTALTIPDWAKSTTGYSVVEGVAIPAGSSLVIYNDGSLFDGSKVKKISFDDISLTKTGDYVDPVVVGIQNVEKAQQNGVIYNLAGQAVKAVQKGLYIKNGKKYIVK